MWIALSSVTLVQLLPREGRGLGRQHHKSVQLHRPLDALELRGGRGLVLPGALEGEVDAGKQRAGAPLLHGRRVLRRGQTNLAR